MSPLAAVSGGFLLAVLWFDLMFDVQVRRHRDGDVPEPVLASIAAYYRRVTTEARPMNRLVALAMLVAIGAATRQLVRGAVPPGRGLLALLLCAAPAALAGWRVVPNAQRLGSRRDPIDVQSALARSIWRDHVLCLASIAAFVLLQLRA